MSEEFFKHPILNSPYEYPARHWELDDRGQPTQKVLESRRRADFITPIPKPKKQSGAQKQDSLLFDEGKGLTSKGQQFDHTAIINGVRQMVDRWRQIPDPSQWQVTPETARLLQHWRHHKFADIRPFFCQVEAVETAIWLTEVAPKAGKAAQGYLEHLEAANEEANPDLFRIALKLATGAGKTTVMAMLIAWQSINAARRPQSKKFTRGFLIVAPGLTIKDRLRVLQPNDPNSYYQSRELVPTDLMGELGKARIVITNYHAFKLRERLELSKGGRALLQGHGPSLSTQESEGQMLQRVVPELMGLKNILVINDEAHHCYREKPGDQEDETLKGDDKKEAKSNLEAARLWINGLEAVKRKLGVSAVFDLSATPFFLRGSGYPEGTLFPWTMSDFSLMDAIESGIVKLPRVPVSDNLIKRDEMPMFRNLWDHIGKQMPKSGRSTAKGLDPSQLPQPLLTALDALYGHYKQTFELWEKEGISVPPCFIIVCNNTATSKLVFDYISGYEREKDDGSTQLEFGRLPLFRNHDDNGNPLPRSRTLLIDSEQLESGDALDTNFRKAAADELDRFKRERVERSGDARDAENITDQDLLREVMNTVGKAGQLGESIRCVVSVSMLTEGWDANTVTHVLGVRAFGTQLLCEQVIGRALRRQSYTVNEDGKFNVEYADVLGIPFDFTAEPVISKPQKPQQTIQVKALRDRQDLEISFPRVAGYRVELPQDQFTAEFNEDSVLTLTPDLVGATETRNSGIIGEPVDLTLAHEKDVRPSQIVYELTSHLVLTKWRDSHGEVQLNQFHNLKRIAREWINGYLDCKGTSPAQLKYKTIADMACDRITAAIVRSQVKREKAVTVVLDPYNPKGSTRHVNFSTSKTSRWDTVGPPPKSHLNWLIMDSSWESEFCRVAEEHPRVVSYVKNHNLGFEVPYRYGSTLRTYIPDFIVRVDDGSGEDDLLNLIVEIKGYRGEDAKEKKSTMENYWVPGVNHMGGFGRWAFAEFVDVYEMQDKFAQAVQKQFGEMIESLEAQAESHA